MPASNGGSLRLSWRRKSLERGTVKRISLRLKFFVLLLGVVVVMLCADIAVSNYSQQKQAETEMLEKAQILAQELDAFWTFMEINEDRINTDSEGNYNYKGLYCVVAAKSVSSIFTDETDYLIHYTNLKTRRPADAPDEFEIEALEAFNGDKAINEFYALTEYEGSEAFRYVQPLYITESCLKCHGEPAGELDVFDYPKEGMKEGDVAGAVSIVMPVDTYLTGIRNSTIQGVVLFAVLLLASLAAIFWGISKLVTRPLAKLEIAAQQIEKGDFDIDVKEVGYKDEINDLSLHIDKMAQELASFYEELESKVVDRTAQLERVNKELDYRQHQLKQANDQLQKENEYKSDFLAIMSHELRTPLTSILAFTEMWERDAGARSERERNAVQEIKINGQILLNIVNNILEMSRVEVGKMELNLEQVDIVDICGIVEHTIKPLADKKELSIEFITNNDVPIIVADGEKLRRILENLVNNAVKFTHNGGKVTVEAKLAEDQNHVKLHVSDNGIGIEESRIDQVFQKYEQDSKSSYRRYKGTGLGLAVVKELVELHGGDIEVESVYKQGSVFIVTLPITQK